MKKKKVTFEHKATSREYLVALYYFPNFVKLLDLNNKPYSKLAAWILEKEVFLKDKDDEFELPSIKALSKQLEIKSTDITKYLKQAYEEIIDLNNTKPMLFVKDGQIECGLSISYFDSHLFFTIGLNVLPRLDEHFEFTFSKHIANIHQLHAKAQVGFVRSIALNNFMIGNFSPGS